MMIDEMSRFFLRHVIKFVKSTSFKLRKKRLDFRSVLDFSLPDPSFLGI